MSGRVLITIVCDSPRHARGKVAKIATYLVNTEAGTAGRLRPRRRRKMHNFRTRAPHGLVEAIRNDAVTESDFTPYLRRDDWVFFTTGEEQMVCKLCGLSLQPGESLTTVLCLIAARLAGDGETDVKLSVVASMLRKQESP